MPKTITVTLTDAQVKLLEHELLDIDQWVKDAVNGRIDYAMNVLADEARDVLMNDPSVDAMPVKRDALVAVYQSRPDYKNRQQRDADEEAQRRAALDAAKALAEQEATARAAATAEIERSIQERIDVAVAKALEKTTWQGSRA